MADFYTVKLTGGPQDGLVNVLPTAQFAWPLPERLRDKGGNYVKVSESRLSPEDDMPHVSLGATYKWRAE